MDLYINKSGQQLGPFAEPKILKMISAGEVSPGDFGIRQGDSDWKNLNSLFPNSFAGSMQTATDPNVSPQKKMSMIRLGAGLIALLSFTSAYIAGYLMVQAYKPGGEPAIWYYLSLACLVFCGLLLLILIVGLFARKGMSYWRTPVLCIFIAVVSFGTFGFVRSKIMTPTRDADIADIKKNLTKMGQSEDTELYKIFMRSIEREEAMLGLTFGLFLLSGVGLIGAGGSIVAASFKNSRLRKS